MSRPSSPVLAPLVRRARRRHGIRPAMPSNWPSIRLRASRGDGLRRRGAPGAAGASLLTIFGALIFVLSAPAPAQVPPRRELTPTYDRHDRCVQCHADLKSGADFVANFSAKTWQEQDKHRRAMSLLEEQAELTKRILGFPLADVLAEGELREDVEREKRAAVEKCLRCHATWPRGHATPPVELRAGVSCQACHGPGFHWSRAHEEKWWRTCAVEEKERLGQRNLRSATVKATLCASCHVGSAAEDRFVTHAMYAAGHPPLPGFELAAFTAQMPAHWRSLPEKGDFAGSPANPYRLTAQDRATLAQLPVDPAALRPDYRAAHYAEFDHDPATDRVTPREVLAGGVAALRSYVDLVDAAAVTSASEARGSWPDFALFDCRACHHELTADESSERAATRDKRRAPAGRPPAPLWPIILASAADQMLAEPNPGDDVSATAAPPRLDLLLRRFDESLTARPFGDPPRMTAAARGLREELERLALRVERGRFDERSADRLVSLLARDRATPAGPRASDDYDAARQLAWSIERLLAANDGVAAGGRSDWRSKYFENESFGDPLRLRLPAGVEASVTGARRESLSAPERFDPEWFRKRLDALKSKKSPPKD